MDTFLQACVNGLMIGGFYSLMGMGQNIIFGVMKIINFCHGEMLMVGMYLTYVFHAYLGLDPYLALPLVALVMFLMGAVFQQTLITPSLGTHSFTNLLFLTVGMGVLLTNLAQALFSRFLTSRGAPHSGHSALRSFLIAVISSAAFGWGASVQDEFEESGEDGDLLGIQTVVVRVIVLACNDQSRLLQYRRLFSYLVHIRREHLGELRIRSVAVRQYLEDPDASLIGES